MNTGALVRQLVILFFIAFMGFGAVKTGLLPKHTNKVLSDLVINVSNPCTVLCSVLTGTRILTHGEVWVLVAVALCLHLFLILLAKVLVPLLGVPKQERNTYRYMTVFGNMSFLGFPVISALFGQEALFPAAIFVLMFQIFCYTYGSNLFQKGAFRLKAIINPMIVSTLLAFLIYMVEIPVPALAQKVLTTVSGITSPAAMLALGCALANVPLGWVARQWRTMVFAALRLTVVPLLTWCLCKPWMINELMLGVTVALTAMPVATNTTLMAARYEKDEDLAASGVAISTLLCVVTMPLILGLLF